MAAGGFQAGLLEGHVRPDHPQEMQNEDAQRRPDRQQEPMRLIGHDERPRHRPEGREQEHRRGRGCQAAEILLERDGAPPVPVAW